MTDPQEPERFVQRDTRSGLAATISDQGVMSDRARLRDQFRKDGAPDSAPMKLRMHIDGHIGGVPVTCARIVLGKRAPRDKRSVRIDCEDGMTFGVFLKPFHPLVRCLRLEEECRGRLRDVGIQNRDDGWRIVYRRDPRSG